MFNPDGCVRSSWDPNQSIGPGVVIPFIESDLQRMLKDSKPKEKYQLVVTPEHVDTYEFDNLNDLITKLRDLQEEESKSPARNKVYIFDGDRLYLTKGRFKYLVTKSGAKKPLFVEPDATEIDKDANLVDPDIDTEIAKEETPGTNYDHLEQIEYELRAQTDWEREQRETMEEMDQA